jgi:hypothetical protein
MSKYKYFLSSYVDGVGGSDMKPIVVVKNVSDGKQFTERDDSMKNQEKLADYSFIFKELKTMLGRVLTVIDASIVDPKQNKAMKDIIRNSFIEEYSFLSDMLYGDTIRKAVEESSSVPDFNPEEVSIEEVAGA